jgi:hypothetical protein
MNIKDNFLDQEKFDELQNIMMGDQIPWYFKYRYYADPSKTVADCILLEPVKEVFQGFINDGKIPTDSNTHRTEPRLQGKAKAKDEALDQFQFTHTFYDKHGSQSPYMEQVNCILEPLHMVSIFRIRANLLTRLPNIVQNPFHVDMDIMSEEKQKEWTTSIFYVNTNDGFTVFEDGTKVESVANRMLTFPANMKHTGTTCTDQQSRIVINFNYYKKIT